MTAWIKTEEHARMMNVLENRIAELDRDCHIYDEHVLELKDRIAELEAENERLRGVCVEFEHHADEDRIQQSNRNAEHHEKTMKQAIKWKRDAERYRKLQDLSADGGGYLAICAWRSGSWRALCGEAVINEFMDEA